MNKNRFDGLQFRIMEVLEKAKGVPLTAREIADRLHDGEYRDQLLDTIVFRVTNAVHAMVPKGKLIKAEARGVGGQLTYTLPQRMKFPPPADAPPPANPVLTPEIAERIDVSEPKPEPRDPQHVVYASGISQAIVDFLDKAPAPMVAPQIVEGLKHMYDGSPAEGDIDRLRMLFGGIIYTLHKDRKILRNNVTGRGRGIVYEYFTRKTGKLAQAKPQPVNADWVKPKSAPTPTPAPASKPQADKPILFRPGVKKVTRKQLNLELPAEKYDQIVAAAGRFDVPIVQFVTDAIDFALSYTEE